VTAATKLPSAEKLIETKVMTDDDDDGAASVDSFGLGWTSDIEPLDGEIEGQGLLFRCRRGNQGGQ